MTPRHPILPAAAVLAALFAAGCGADRRRPAAVETRPADASRMSPRDLQNTTAVSAVLAGAKAGQAEVAAAKAPSQKKVVVAVTVPVPPAPAAPPAPAPAAVTPPVPPAAVTTVVSREPAKASERVQPSISLSVRSDKPHPSKERALEDALQVAQFELQSALAKLNPPVTAKPSLATIRSEYLRKDGIREEQPSEAIKAEWKDKGLDAKRLWVKIDVDVSEDQVRQLRAGERVSTGFQYGAVLFASLLAVYGFLRLDAWTKGYLTSWLAIGAVALVAVALLAVLA